MSAAGTATGPPGPPARRGAAGAPLRRHRGEAETRPLVLKRPAPRGPPLYGPRPELRPTRPHLPVRAWPTRTAQLAVVVADEEEVARPRDESRRHPELHRPDARFARSRLRDERLHRERCARGAFLVQLAVEEEKQRVAAELEHVPAVASSDLDQPRVAPADEGDQLLGSELAAFGEPLRECRETRDVEAEQRRVEDLCDLVAPIPMPDSGQNGRRAEAVAVVTLPSIPRGYDSSRARSTRGDARRRRAVVARRAPGGPSRSRTASPRSRAGRHGR